MTRGGLMALAAAVPLLLLCQSQDIRILTRVERDGSGLRLVWAQSDASRAREICTWLREATQFYEDERQNVQGSQYVISRSWRPHTLGLVPESKLDITDVPQRPFSLFNEYYWEEKLKIYAGPATMSEKAGAAEARLLYILEMPGRIDPASVSPAGQISGGKVAWVLTGDKEEYVLRAGSKMLRWDLLLVVLFVLVAATGKTVEWLLRKARQRPRLI